MEKNCILYGETQATITELLISAMDEARANNDSFSGEVFKRCYMNWAEFLLSLKSDGSLFGLTA